MRLAPDPCDDERMLARAACFASHVPEAHVWYQTVVP